MKLTKKEKQIIQALKSGGVLIAGKCPEVSFNDGRPRIKFTFSKFCDLQEKGILKYWGNDFILCV